MTSKQLATTKKAPLQVRQFVAASAAALALAGAGALAFYPGTSQAQLGQVTVGPASGQVVSGLPDFTQLVDQVGPSVVNIRTTEKVTTRNMRGMPGMDDDMLEFFRQFGLPVPGMPQQRRGQQPAEPQSRTVPSGVGSGFILSSDGYILTNHHVVAGAEDVIVTLTDHREFNAKVIGSDERTDVALIKIEAKNLPAVRIGNVEQLKVGEWVMAIGSPFGLDNSVTAGIVSAKQRDTGSYLPFIQTDVAVNPGNSGGPLLNMRGEVVGINSQIYSRSGGFMGISFAIPIDDAIKVSDQLKDKGRVVRGRIGVRIGPVNPDVAESLGLERRSNGALVASVEKDSPAAKAGVQAGDIITGFNGRALDSVSDLPRMVGNAKPGSKNTLQVFRHGKSVDLPVVVEEVTDDSANAADASSNQDQGASKEQSKANEFGLAVQALPTGEAKTLGVRGGVRVVSVEGAADQAGIQPGDVILAVGQREVLDVNGFNEAMGKADAKRPISVLVHRDDWAQYVLIRPAK
ncbi:DegQ family serine endoprotease [Lampropedia puyangensis]|uniref:Probable periplasmic serine endoprotease DegP-like n=1 Tax=Lampropedia puyangensis TaxID=1330072 RepID=A0A4S8F965_9BURK|nr:DegQ family serine endoprotease [Lampropedia puyangensis]THU03759.1 DegQ family serine endoprotease [Lampropedia puyangensis]